MKNRQLSEVCLHEEPSVAVYSLTALRRCALISPVWLTGRLLSAYGPVKPITSTAYGPAKHITSTAYGPVKPATSSLPSLE